MPAPRLMAVLAHPDDESLGVGGTLAKYASEGVKTSQVVAYERLQQLSSDHHEELWGWQSFYRVFSAVNGGRSRETDLFEGIRV